MKKLSLLLLCLTLTAAMASAELLVTANPLGKGKWAALGTLLHDENTLNVAARSLATTGGYVGYGINEKLDVFVQYGQSTIVGLPAGLTTFLTGTGVLLKYAIAGESASMPVSTSAGIGYKSMTIKASALAGGDSTGTQILGGFGVSKLMIPFIPYGGLLYRSSSSSAAASNSTQIDLTLGSAIAWSVQGAVFVEYTLQSIRHDTAGNFTSGQYGIGVGYSI